MSVNFINLLDQEVLWLIIKSSDRERAFNYSPEYPWCLQHAPIISLSLPSGRTKQTWTKWENTRKKKRTKRDNKIPKSLVFSLSVFSSMLPVSFCHSIPHTRSKSSFLQRQVIHFTQTCCASCRDPVSTLLFNMHHAFWMFPTFHPWQRDVAFTVASGFSSGLWHFSTSSFNSFPPTARDDHMIHMFDMSRILKKTWKNTFLTGKPTNFWLFSKIFTLLLYTKILPPKISLYALVEKLGSVPLEPPLDVHPLLKHLLEPPPTDFSHKFLEPPNICFHRVFR